MTIDPFDLELGLWDCRGIRGESDVVDVARIIAQAGLVPGVGPWTATSSPRPVALDELASFIPTVHFGGEVASRTPGRLTPVESWGYAAICEAMPSAQAQVGFGRLGADKWEVFLLVSTWSHSSTSAPLPEFASSWAETLERIGATLYARTRPVLGALTASSPNSFEADECAAHAERRRFVGGWRTWFGPEYVRQFGAECLLGLPDRATRLDDGGVRHALDGPALELVLNDPSIYQSVGQYLDGTAIEAAWPPSLRRKRAARGGTPGTDGKVTQT